MKRQKGFTLVEIVVTFCLVSTISFLLFQLILSIKNLYTTSDYKTVLLIEQGNMTRRINTDMFTMPLLKVEDCSNEKNVCWLFTVRDLALDKNVTKRLEVYENSIVYDGYKMNIDNGTKIGDVSAVVSYIDDSSVTYNAMLTIDIPITNKLVEGNYGLHLIIQYNTSDAQVEEAAINESNRITIVTTTVSDILRKATTSGDGLYNYSGESWYYGLTSKEYYNSVKNDLPKYVFRGASPNNWVIFNRRCYRIMSITADSTLKMIYEGESDGGI